MMTALLLYGYAVGVTSSRKLEKLTQEDVAFRVISAGIAVSIVLTAIRSIAREDQAARTEAAARKVAGAPP